MAMQGKAAALPRVLLIEDNFDHVELLAHQLNCYCVDLMVAQSGCEGWAILQKEKIDLLILDYALPDLDGLTFLKRLRCRAWLRPVVMMTAHLECALTEEAGRHGANYFVQKTAAAGFMKRIGEIVARELRLNLRQKMPSQELPPLLRFPQLASVWQNALN